MNKMKPVIYDQDADPSFQPYDWAKDEQTAPPLPVDAKILRFPVLNESDNSDNDYKGEVIDITPALEEKWRNRNPLEKRTVVAALGVVGTAGMYFATNGGKTPWRNIEAIWQYLT